MKVGRRKMRPGERDHAYRLLAQQPPEAAAALAPRLGVEWPPPKRSKSYGPTKNTRKAVYERDNYTCVKCGLNMRDTPELLTVDHKLPRSKGGSNRRRNLQTMCPDCNKQKGNKIG